VGEPLLDLEDEEIRLFLKLGDDADRMRSIQKFTLISTVACIPRSST